LKYALEARKGNLRSIQRFHLWLPSIRAFSAQDSLRRINVKT
jgi:hypothetical protein